MAANEAKLQALTAKIYEAASDPALWPDFLKGYAESVHADVAAMQIHHLQNHRSEILATFGMTFRFKQSYNEHYSKLNVWRERGQRLYVPGQVLLNEELCSDSLLKNSEFYNDYLLPMGAGSHGTATVIARQDDDATTLTALRREGRQPFGELERQIAKLLLPHLIRAHAIEQKLEILRAAETVLDSVPFGLVFLTPRGKSVYVNRVADAIFRSGDGLSLHNGSLRGSNSTAQAALDAAIRQAASPGSSLLCPGAILAERKSARPYQILIAPLRRCPPRLVGTAAPTVVALILDPERAQLASTDLMRRLYGLTRKEAAFAQALCRGKSVEQAAQELEIRYETARTHLRRIFSKTGTSRQAELVMLLGRLWQLYPGD